MNPRFEIPLADVMTGDLIFLHPDDSLRKVDEVFDNYTIHHILLWTMMKSWWESSAGSTF
jgi:predicted transcriptional regulator